VFSLCIDIDIGKWEPHNRIHSFEGAKARCPPDTFSIYHNSRGTGGGPSGRTHIGPLTRAMARRMEEEEEEIVQKTLFLWRIKF